MTYTCRAEGLSFLESAPEKVINVVEIPANIEAIFKVFEDAEAWPAWFEGISSVEWTSPKPFNERTTRTVQVGPMTVWEQFFLWDAPNRFAFYFEKTSLPFVKALVEDYKLETIDDNNTRFSYTVAYEPGLLLKLSGPLGRRALRKTFGKASKALVNYMKNKEA